MSRSALWRQEGNVKERERNAEELFRSVVEEGRMNRSKNLLTIWGPDDNFHFNPMLLQNIIKSPYFQKCCKEISDWNTLVDEIYYSVKHLEPWTVGAAKSPSTAFCLLLRLLTLRCTEKQMTLLLQHRDSPYIRGIGFLYLRYSCDPNQVWKWIEPYLYDQEPLQVQVSASKQEAKANDTVGSFVRFLFSERNYYGTMLPRWPIQIEREIQVNLLQAEKTEDRAKQHASKPQQMSYFKTLGSKVQALYGDEENPVTWYDAVVDRVITKDEDTNEVLRFPKFVVTFPEYGNTEIVTLGEMDMPGTNSGPLERDPPGSSSRLPDVGRSDNRGYASRGGYGNDSRDRRRGYDENERGGGGGSSRDRGSRDRGDRGERRGSASSRASGGGGAAYPPNDLYEEVRRRERETVTTSGRNGAMRRPPSTKSSMVSSLDNRHQNHHARDDHHRDFRTHSPSPSGGSRAQSQQSMSSKDRPPSPPPRKRTADELAANQAKKQKLLAKYG